jgi:hypothetical protein
MRVIERGAAPYTANELRVLQSLAGNAAVQRLLVQRDGDDTNAATDDTATPGPDIFDAAFQPDDIVSAMAGMGLGAADLAPGVNRPLDDSQVTAQALFLQRDPPPQSGTGPGLPAVAPPTKPAGIGDLFEALSKVPEVADALKQLKQMVLDSWEALLKGEVTAKEEKVVAFTIAGAAIVLGGVAGVASDPDLRKKAATSGVDALNNAKIPVPIPGLNGSLSITPKTANGALQGGTVNVDVLQLFPKLRKVAPFN